MGALRPSIYCAGVKCLSGIGFVAVGNLGVIQPNQPTRSSVQKRPNSTTAVEPPTTTTQR